MEINASNDAKPVIYSELLSNIRQVSIAATLSSPPDATTKAEILDDGQLFQIHHQGHTETLGLPARVSMSTAISIPSGKAVNLAWRLPVSAADSQPSRFSPENQALPWNSLDLKDQSPISCRECSAIIVGHGKITAWKDLPSENWAEMMEFWHCHKPHNESHTHGQQGDETLADNKGYGANNVISAQDGIGFVDLASFMFSESDCTDLTVSFSPYAYNLRLPFPIAGRKKVAMSAFMPLSDLETDTTPR